MPQARKLTLKKETLTALTTDELRRVVGADATAVTQPVKVCVTELLSCGDYCISWETEPCWDPA